MELRKWTFQLAVGFVMLGALLLLLYSGYAREQNKPVEASKPVMTEPAKGLAMATFAGGCFWCMESPFDKLPGVVSTTVGYTGGQIENPTYEQVSAGTTGHTEAVRIIYDPKKLTYQELLDVFLRQINPTSKDRQFVDVGTQYRTGIYYHDESQKAVAVKTLDALEKSGRFGAPIMTEVKPVGRFFPAEDYHQDFYQKSPQHYENYRANSGRDQYLNQIWGESQH